MQGLGFHRPRHRPRIVLEQRFIVPNAVSGLGHPGHLDYHTLSAPAAGEDDESTFRSI